MHACTQKKDTPLILNRWSLVLNLYAVEILEQPKVMNAIMSFKTKQMMSSSRAGAQQTINTLLKHATRFIEKSYPNKCDSCNACVCVCINFMMHHSAYEQSRFLFKCFTF